MEKEITFILPCLNEEKSLEYCIKEIKKYIQENQLDAEILVADNLSKDNSRRITKNNEVRLTICNKKGYGNTLINGMNHANGRYCIMGDSDGSYDFSNLQDYIKGLREGYDLVVGNRFKGGIEKGAMSISHKIGVKGLSAFANFFFHAPVKDYHCGLRAYNTESMKKIHLIQGGMEYASEMIIKAKINNLRILEVPTVLRKDLRHKKSHIRTIRDGMRHVILICKLAINKNKYKIKEL